jgi:uncharacterized protein (TIGR02145 family)
VIVDGDGNIYQSVKIGNQEWLTENLRTTKYIDGSHIANMIMPEDWQYITGPAYSWYDNDSVTNKIYGVLYNLYAANSAKLCPKGWHVATENDWNELFTFLGGESVAANKLKETGTQHWLSTSVDVTNETGFSALPGSWRDDAGYFGNIGFFGYWWAATLNSTASGNSICMSYESGQIYKAVNRSGSHGLSVRCVKNQ